MRHTGLAIMFEQVNAASKGVVMQFSAQNAMAKAFMPVDDSFIKTIRQAQGNTRHTHTCAHLCSMSWVPIGDQQTGFCSCAQSQPAGLSNSEGRCN